MSDDHDNGNGHDHDHDHDKCCEEIAKAIAMAGSEISFALHAIADAVKSLAPPPPPQANVLKLTATLRGGI